MVVIDSLYLIEGVQKCFRCGKKTRVIGFGIDKHLPIYIMHNLHKNYSRNIKNALEYINQHDIHVVGPITPIPEFLMKYIKSKYNHKIKYSKFTKTSNISNCCEYYDVLQGDFFLFDEVNSPFFFEFPRRCKKTQNI